MARPTLAQLAAAKHHFIACRSVTDPYNVFAYEQDALACLAKLFQHYDTVVAVGGSGLYVDALRHGISVLPDPDPSLREELQKKLREEGVNSLRAMLRILDPDYYAQVDLANGVRIQRALEVTLTAGTPYSKLVNQPPRPRPFEITVEVITREREELRQRIDSRVTMMMEQGEASIQWMLAIVQRRTQPPAVVMAPQAPFGRFENGRHSKTQKTPKIEFDNLTI